jgi:hypothetical protein
LDADIFSVSVVIQIEGQPQIGASTAPSREKLSGKKQIRLQGIFVH